MGLFAKQNLMLYVLIKEGLAHIFVRLYGFSRH